MAEESRNDVYISNQPSELVQSTEQTTYNQQEQSDNANANFANEQNERPMEIPAAKVSYSTV